MLTRFRMESSKRDCIGTWLPFCEATFILSSSACLKISHVGILRQMKCDFDRLVKKSLYIYIYIYIFMI